LTNQRVAALHTRFLARSKVKLAYFFFFFFQEKKRATQLEPMRFGLVKLETFHEKEGKRERKKEFCVERERINHD